MFPWVSFLTYVVITAITPGPNNIMSMSCGTHNGFWKALPFNLGIWVGFSVVAGLCAVFCAVLTDSIPKLVLPMKLLGALYLLYLAWGTFRSGGNLDTQNRHDGFLADILLQFINPKIYLYCIMSMEAFILPHFAGNQIILLAFSLLLAFIGFCATLCWSAFGAAFQKLLESHSKKVNSILALLLVYCAVSLFL